MAPTQLKKKSFFLFGLWLLLLSFGFWRLMFYANTPGEGAVTGTDWPTEAQLDRPSHSGILIIFTHPYCPCSMATLGELERLVPHFQGKIHSSVFFFKPKEKDLNWVKSDAWKKVQLLQGVNTFVDEDGKEAAKFGAKTSGQALLYNSEGHLVFNGGITPERGHMGDSVGRSAILRFLSKGDSVAVSSPVFGCSLVNPARAVTEGEKSSE